MEIHADGASDVGKVRETNEDAFCVEPELGLFAVADGMGGHEAGEVASHMALEALHGCVQAAYAPGAPERTVTEILRDAVNAAAHAVRDESGGDGGKKRMGTTLTALHIRGDRGAVAHVGDSRLYRVRWGEVDKLTEDHTAAQELVKAGAIPAEAAEDHPMSHILSRVIGSGRDVEAQLLELELVEGDRFLLCSDGFSAALRDPRWLTWLSTQEAADDTAAKLVARAIELDGRDNATAVVVAIGGAERREERRSAWERLSAAVTGALGLDSST